MFKNKLINNAVWLLLERLISALGALFITIYTARYLGPENMGIINYAIAIGAIIVPLAKLGSDSLIFDRTAKNEVQGRRLLKFSQGIRRVIYFIVSVFLFFIISMVDESINRLVVIGIFFSFYFTSLDSYKPFFDATLQSNKNAIYSQLGLFSAHIARLVFIFFSLPLQWFTIPYILNSAIPYLFKKYYFNKKNDAIRSKRLIKKYRNFSIHAGVPLAISGLSIVLYLKVSQLLLVSLVGVYDVGIYSAAATLGQSWIFIPVSFITVCLTKIAGDQKNKEIGFSFLYFTSFIISFPFIFFIYIFDTEIIQLTFGQEFYEISEVLLMLTCSSFFSVWGVIGYRIIINQGGYKYLMKKMIFMALINIIISYYFIYNFGLIGAGISMLITEVLSATLGNYFFKRNYILKRQVDMPRSLLYFKYLK